jgi:hypothetical protein
MNNLQHIFQPHQFGPGEDYVDLWHVYDNLSQTPYQTGIGIQCGDPREFYVKAWHIITPKAMRRHLDWRNRNQTQFISFYDNENQATREAQRRRDSNMPGRGLVRIAHVRIPNGTGVWVFSRREMLSMMLALDDNGTDLITSSGSREWFVWGVVPEHLVRNIW